MAILRKIRRIMYEHYGLKKLSIRPIGSGSSRLSIPIKLSGINEKGERVNYFGKILGSSDFISSLSIQFLKNIYLHMNAQDPIFDASTSAKELATHQFEALEAIFKSGIPTAKVYGCYAIDEIRWLLVVEYVDAKPLSIAEIGVEVLETAFRHLERLHKKKIFHGDIKPDNIMLGKEIYILDVGRFREGVPDSKKLAYDLACLICSFLHARPAEEIIEMARKFYSKRDIRAAAEYIGLVQRRPDIYFTDETANKLRRLMRS